MPDESDFRNYKTVEEFGKTIEGNKYLHSIYARAVGHPIRREILNIVNKAKRISKDDLLENLLESKIIKDEYIFNYNMDYLIKAFCIEKIEDEGKIYYEITQSGQVVDYLWVRIEKRLRSVILLNLLCLIALTNLVMLLVFVFPAAALAIGIIAASIFPIDKKKYEEIKLELEKLHKKKRERLIK